jgi:hypothetical protein
MAVEPLRKCTVEEILQGIRYLSGGQLQTWLWPESLWKEQAQEFSFGYPIVLAQDICGYYARDVLISIREPNTLPDHGGKVQNPVLMLLCLRLTSDDVQNIVRTLQETYANTEVPKAPPTHTAWEHILRNLLPDTFRA